MNHTETRNRFAKREADDIPTAMLLDRRLPFDLDAERGIVGSLILYPDCYDDVASEISPDDFFDEANRTLYEAIAALRDSGKPVDVTLLVAGLKTAGFYETVGGAAYIYRVTESVANASNAVYYSRIVREHALRRAVIQASTETLRDAYEERSDVSELVGKADARIAEISERTIVPKSGGGHVKDILHLAMDDLDARASGKIEQRKTGLCGLDRIIGGLRKKQFVVFGARPSQGKTSLLLKVALNLASGNNPLHVLFVTLEMGETELAERMLSMVAQVNSWKMQNGRCTEGDRRHIVEAAANIAKAPLWIRDPGSITASQLAAMARSYRRKCKGLDVLCVDYLQIIQTENGPRNESRQQQLGKITRRLKQIAKDQDLIVIAPAQLNRDADRSSREPRLSDLREAGDIENDADVVVMCHMPGAEDDKKRPVKSEDGEDCKLLVRKNRNGPTGEAEMYYFRAFSLWGDKQTNEERFREPPPQPRFSEFDNYNANTDQYGEF
jgi:replicative DNA helicase